MTDKKDKAVLSELVLYPREAGQTTEAAFQKSMQSSPSFKAEKVDIHIAKRKRFEPMRIVKTRAKKDQSVKKKAGKKKSKKK